MRCKPAYLQFTLETYKMKPVFPCITSNLLKQNALNSQKATRAKQKQKTTSTAQKTREGKLKLETEGI